MDNKQLILINRVDELQKLNAFLDELAAEWSITDKIKNQLNLVLEEVVSNIIFYAFDNNTDNEITIDFQIKDRSLQTTISDSGKAFDITAVNDYDEKDKPAEERAIGGLGIHFVKKLIDSVQ